MLVEWKAEQDEVKEVLGEEYIDYNLVMATTFGNPIGTGAIRGQLKKLIEELKTEFDYILLDCPAGIEQGFQNAIAGADRGIVVTTPEVSAIRDADRIIGLLEAHGIKNNDLIINRLRIDMVKRGDMMSVEDVTEILASHLLGVIPDDEQVVIATNQGEPIVGEDCMSGKAYANICRRLLGEEIPITDFGRSEGLFSKFRDLFKKN